MERRTLAQELRRWAVEEMGLPAQKAPSEDTLQRLFIGQYADIWKFIIRHVYSQRTVRKIEGNLLWYQQLQRSEAQRSAEEEEQQRRKKLCKEILELRTELQHLQEQIQCCEQEISSQEMNTERVQDLCRRSLLLQAFNKKREEEYTALSDSNLKIHYRCEQMQDIRRASQKEVILAAVDSGSDGGTALESEVMRNVRAVCQMRFQFLKSLHDDSVSGSARACAADVRSLSHQQWVSLAERVWSTHPPNHIVTALEHLALEAHQQLRKHQSAFDEDSSDSSKEDSELYTELQESKERLKTRSLREDARQSLAGALPSFNSLMQEGWAETVQICTQMRLIQNHTQKLSDRLAELTQEARKSLSDGIALSALSRTAFDVELQSVALGGLRDALLQECRTLQDEAVAMRVEVKLLDQLKCNIQHSYLIMVNKQNLIQILITGNSAHKSQLRRSTTEVQNYIQEKLLPQPQEVMLESQRLQDSVQKEVKHFTAISLSQLLRICVDGGNCSPIQDLSINRFSNTHCPYYGVFKGIYESIGLSLYKAPEITLSHVADMKKQMFFLRSQLSSHSQAISRLHLRLREHQNPDTTTLLQQLSTHYAQQIDHLVPKLQHLIQQCKKSQEYGKEVQATVSDWWEQPAQMCLPWETREGLTFRQWRDRWTVAMTTLQTASRS
ncbi:HAUS augmin-like complex subunit 5 [Bombina bombina]|uniref:HAUS augmin-like complex subunit 5 n=1 Tax=Bombina bombina TaxID=8345 RepID=UPI00235A892C|nr:HAUS augmin-like complex subunit 5 [Bombina bombina]